MRSRLLSGRFLHYSSVVFSALIFYSCGDNPGQSRATRHLSMMDDSLIQYNKSIVSKEDQQIDDFIERHSLQMKKTSTGLRYQIIRSGKGIPAAKDKTASIIFTVRLLNGDPCYSSGPDHPREFVIGHSTVESGLEEGILLMNVGDRAKFIVPSHLAFGLLGDQDKIPERATLVYDVELIKVK